MNSKKEKKLLKYFLGNSAREMNGPTVLLSLSDGEKTKGYILWIPEKIKNKKGMKNK